MQELEMEVKHLEEENLRLKEQQKQVASDNKKKKKNTVPNLLDICFLFFRQKKENN